MPGMAHRTSVRVDNGSEFTSGAFTDWAAAQYIEFDFMQPGCRYQNSYVERFNRTYRQDVVNLYLFVNLHEVREITERWREIYNYEAPHDSLNHMTPKVYL